MSSRGTLSLLIFLFASVSLANTQQFLPVSDCEKYIDYTYYSICYSPEHRQAQWTKHELTRQSITGKAKRDNSYRRDPQLKDPVEGSDYRGSGYDRGHLVPAADMKLNKTAMSETFYMTNMSPQAPGFNRGIWASLERDVRDLVMDHGDGHVVSAPVLENGLKRIRSGVSIPLEYYKILYIPEQQKMYAWLFSNRTHSHSEPEDFFVSVDEIEQITGIDFFSELPDALEDRLEAQVMH